MLYTPVRVTAAAAALYTILCLPSAARAQSTIDDGLAVNQQASTVGFTLYAKMLFKLKQEGQFKDFAGKVLYDPARPADTKVDLTVYTASVDTNSVDHDALLRSPDFFNVDKYPTMRFVSTSTVVHPDGSLAVTGDLTIRGITKRLEVPVTIAPAARNGDGSQKFETTFEIDRTEFGLTGTPQWSGLKVTIARNVKIHLAIAMATSALGMHR